MALVPVRLLKIGVKLTRPAVQVYVRENRARPVVQGQVPAAGDEVTASCLLEEEVANFLLLLVWKALLLLTLFAGDELWAAEDDGVREEEVTKGEEDVTRGDEEVTKGEEETAGEELEDDGCAQHCG